MNTVCPKCSYERTAADTAPDWQCPACGIAYAKFAKLKNDALQEVSPGNNIQPLPDPATEWSGSASTAAKIIIALVAVLTFVGARYALTASHERTAAPKAYVEQPTNAVPERLPVAAAPPPQPVAQEPELPVDSLKELFESAYERGEANGLMVINSGGKSLSPNFNPVQPVHVSVNRGSALSQPQCNRYKVTLMQGGEMTPLPDGRTVKSALTMRYAYSVNYCIGGQPPDGGRQLTIEQ